jgi:CrcB protein
MQGYSELPDAIHPVVKAFLLPGLLGGFTTFSTFALDGLTLHSERGMTSALLYIGGSVVLGLFAAALGLTCSRSLA